MRIRKATTEDYKNVMGLYQKFSADPKKFGNFENNSFLKLVQGQTDSISIALVDEQIIGFISYSIRHVVRYSRPLFLIEELFVEESYRKQGVGKTLIDHCIKIAKDRACQHIDVLADSENAIKFYKKCGFGEKYKHLRFILQG